MKSIYTTEHMDDYLHDESRSTGCAAMVLFPESEADVVRLMREHPDALVTVQGSRTGLTAGCVPDGGIVLNLGRMDKALKIIPAPLSTAAPASVEAPPIDPKASTSTPLQPGCCTAVVQPGLSLQALREALQGTGFWFPPDPTETSASIGGMIANDSSGARSYKYGSMREHVLSIRVVLRDGEVLQLRRSPDSGSASEPFRTADPVGTAGPTGAGIIDAYGGFVLRTESGREIRGRLPNIPVPRVSKNVAGYYIRPDMDLIDLFIGSEGTLGVVTEAELRLWPVPGQVWGCMVFFKEEEQALSFVERIQRQKSAEAIEYFDRDVLALMRQEQENGVVLREHVLVPEDRCAVYVEYAGASREDMTGHFSFVRECIADLGADPSETWLAAGSTDLEKLKEFRHAAPLCVNHVIAETKKTYSTITKLGTDMSVPTGCLRQVFRMYRSGLRSFRAAVFGHIGDNHIHVNIMPRNPEEYASAKALYTEWARRVSAMGGSVSAEHGIGKLKRWLLAEMYTREHLEGMRALKRVFDPRELLGRGNMFDTKEPLVDERGEME